MNITALAAHTDGNRVFLWGGHSQGDIGLRRSAASGNAEIEPILSEPELREELEDMLDMPELNEVHIAGMALDPNGRIIAAINVEDGALFTTPWLVRLDPQGDTPDEIVDIAISPEELGWDDVEMNALDNSVRDVKVHDDRVYATNEATDGDALIRLDIDLAPASRTAVTLDGDDFLGPQRFAAQRPGAEFIIVSDWDEDPANARIVGFADAGGGEWSEFAADDDPFSFFDFY